MSRYHQFTLPATVDHSDVLGGYGQHLCFATSHEFAVQIADALNTAADKDRQIDALTERIERLRTEMIRLRDCDWVISLPDRMDAVRDIARKALADDDKEKI